MSKVRFLFVLMTIILILLSSIEMVMALFRIDVNADAVYYLGVSRLIIEGEIPFIDFPPGYTPLSFYLMAIPLSILQSSFTVALICLYLLHLMNASIIYKIVRCYTSDKFMAIFISSFSLLLCLGADGCRYILEPFVLFFGLLALYLLKLRKRKWIILSGFLCFCSFGCKQYGLGFILLAIISTIFDEKFNRRHFYQLFYLLCGFFGGLLLFLLYFLMQGVAPLALISLSGNNYERDGISGLLGGWMTLLITLPLLIIAILKLIICLKNGEHLYLLFISFIAVLGFMLQCYVRFYAHYLMLAMPFCALMLFACIDSFHSRKMKTIYLILLALSPVICIYFTSKSVMSLMEENKRDKQEICAKAIENIIPVGSQNVFASMDVLPFMFINSYNPPLISKYGLSNGFVRKSEEVNELIHASAYCIISADDLKKTQKYTDELCEYLSAEFTKTQLAGLSQSTSFYIYVRKKD